MFVLFSLLPFDEELMKRRKELIVRSDTLWRGIIVGILENAIWGGIKTNMNKRRNNTSHTKKRKQRHEKRITKQGEAHGEKNEE